MDKEIVNRTLIVLGWISIGAFCLFLWIGLPLLLGNLIPEKTRQVWLGCGWAAMAIIGFLGMTAFCVIQDVVH